MLFAALLVAASLFSSAAAQLTFMGCSTTIPVTLIVSSQASLAACIPTCNPALYSYLFYNSISKGCYCGVIGPAAGTLTTGAAGTCTTSTLGPADVYNIRTSFTFQRCAASVSGGTTAAGSPFLVQDSCFNACKTYRYAIMAPTFLSLWSCQCSNTAPTMSGSSACSGYGGSAPNLVYTHTASAAGSGLARREDRWQMAIQYEMDNSEVDFKYCPAGRTACSISYDRADGYECIDTDTELESCGGCRFGNYAYDTDVVGEDCHNINGTASGGAVCREGRCVVSRCSRRHQLVDGQCVPMRS